LELADDDVVGAAKEVIGNAQEDRALEETQAVCNDGNGGGGGSSGSDDVESFDMLQLCEALGVVEVPTLSSTTWRFGAGPCE